MKRFYFKTIIISASMLPFKTLLQVTLKNAYIQLKLMHNLTYVPAENSVLSVA